MLRGRVATLCLLALFVWGGATTAQGSAWEKIAPYFVVPKEFEGEMGGYRSVLKFGDGREVKGAADWGKRRAEILAEWHGLMGAWPALLERPRVEMGEAVKGEGFVRHTVRVEIARDRFETAYLLVPEGKGPLPAVLVPFYDIESSVGNKGQFRDYALQLAKRGFVTLAIPSPGGDARDFVKEVGGATCQPLSYLAYVAANCAQALAQRPEVDAKRIGVVGHSYGGKWAMFASCLSERFAAAVWSDPGIVFDEPRSNVNYWEPWYLGFDATLAQQRKPGLINAQRPRTGPYKVMMEKGMDLHELHALMAPRPFLVSGGSEDPPARWVALNHAVAVNRVLGVEGRVGMHNRKAHSPDEGANEVVYSFFEHFLKGGEK